jgi:Tol biopolymer transport system component/frataxin-like iron-binding protein CyaY
MNPWADLSGELDARYSLDELNNLYFELDVDPANLPGETKRTKLNALIRRLDRRREMHKLVHIGRANRPDIPWDDLIRAGLAQRYQQAAAAFQAARWQEVVSLCTEIEGLSPGYRDARELCARARSASAVETIRPEPSPAARLSVPGWAWAAGILVVLALLVAILTLQGDGQPALPPTASPAPTLTIASHHDGQMVERTAVITGTYAGLGPGWQLWSIVKPFDSDYWAGEHVALDQPQGAWSFTARFGYPDTRDVGNSFQFLVLAVAQDSDAEKYLTSTQGRAFQELPGEQVHVFTPGVTLIRTSPAGHWLADFWPDGDRTADPASTQTISSTYLFREWWEPPHAALPEDDWTARFMRRIDLPQAGEVCFQRVYRGEMDVWVDEQKLDFPAAPDGWQSVTRVCPALAAGQHELRVDYTYADGAPGIVELWYEGPGLQPPVGSLAGPWQATFYPTPALEGMPLWSTSAAGPFLDVDMHVPQAPVVNFGAVFTGTLALTQTGTYRFHLDVDDGARLFIDGTQVLDEYHFGPATYTVEKQLAAGDHVLRLEFYEYYWAQYATLTWEKIPARVAPVQRILFVSDRDGDADVYAMDANGANPVRLTHNEYPDRDPAWSPDGRRIVFAADPERDGLLELYTMDAGGGDVTPLGVSGYQPRWSPDGSRIAFVSEQAGQPSIHVMDVTGADGANPVQLTPADSNAYFPDWSPDGAQLVFESDRDGNYEIYRMRSDGSGLENLSQNPGAWDGTPTWSPDGARIAFASVHDDDSELYVMDADGDNPHRLTDNEADDRVPDWSPDGRFLVYEVYAPEDGVTQLFLGDARGTAPPTPLTDHWADHERPQWSPPGYGYTFESFTDSNDVNSNALAVAGDYVWTGGSGGVVRWNREHPDQHQLLASEDGVAENKVRTILADGASTLWIGTGAWTFDGSGVSRYTLGGGREGWRTYTAADGLGENVIFHLYQDSQGRIWAGTPGAGVRVWDGERWQGLEGLQEGWVLYVFESSEGIFWFGRSGGGVMRYDPAAAGDAAWQQFDLVDLLETQNAGYNFASGIVEDADGGLWITTNGGVVHYDGQTWRRVKGFVDTWTSSGVRDTDGALWFSIGQVVRLDPDGQQRSYTAGDGLAGDVSALFLDDAGVLWAAGDGLNRYDRERDRWEGYRVPATLADNHVSAILPDAGGTLWFGHGVFQAATPEGAGVTRHTPGSAGAWQRYDTDDGLGQNAVRVMSQDREGIIWFGFGRAGGGVCRYDPHQAQWLPCYPADPSGLVSDQVGAILETRDGALWFGTAGGLSRFDGERWETFTQASALLTDSVRCLAEDAEGALWVTTNQGANRFFYETGEWTAFNTHNSDLIADDVLAVAPDGSGGLWFGTREGLSHYDVRAKKWQSLEETPELAGWIDHCAPVLHVDRYGTLWVGTDEGLYRSTPGGGWLRLTTANGLASNRVLAIAKDAEGTLWIGTPNGVSRLHIGD